MFLSFLGSCFCRALAFMSNLGPPQSGYHTVMRAPHPVSPGENVWGNWHLCSQPGGPGLEFLADSGVITEQLQRQRQEGAQVRPLPRDLANLVYLLGMATRLSTSKEVPGCCLSRPHTAFMGGSSSRGAAATVSGPISVVGSAKPSEGLGWAAWAEKSLASALGQELAGHFRV